MYMEYTYIHTYANVRKNNKKERKKKYIFSKCNVEYL